MDKIFLGLALLSMAGVVGALIAGLVALSRTAPEARQTSQKMMQWRVKLQGAAILFLFLAYFTKS